MPTAEAYRSDVAELVRLATSDLETLWRKVNSATMGRDLLLDVLPQLTVVYGSAAASLAADWYDDVRAEAGVKGRFTAITAELPDRGRTDALARWGTSPLFAAEPNFDTSFTLVTGGLQRIIADGGRGTITGSSVADPAASGWQRVGSGECTFCEMLIARGAVYTEATADFGSHDHCKCAAVPAFHGQPQPVKPFTPSLRDSTEADRARVREYLRTH